MPAITTLGNAGLVWKDPAASQPDQEKVVTAMTDIRKRMLHIGGSRQTIGALECNRCSRETSLIHINRAVGSDQIAAIREMICSNLRS